MLTSVLAASCGGSSGSQTTQSSGSQAAEETTKLDLAKVVVPKEQLGGEFAALPTAFGGPTDGAGTVASNTVDPNDTAMMIVNAGWTDGYLWGYVASDHRPELEAGVDVFKEESAAAAFVSKQITDWSRFRDDGRGTTTSGVKEFAVPPIGSGTVGFESTVVFAPTEKDYWTFIRFYDGRLAAFVAIIRDDHADSRQDAKRVAKLLERRMQAILSGD